MGEVTVMCPAGQARETMRQFPGTVARSARRSNFLFRLAEGGEHFECIDTRTDEEWRPAGPGNLLYVEAEEFILELGSPA
ncbi:MAG: hypothetical protein K2P78_06630 [Gemmataceae bacterium]|nr:hypothetical protein [Gemmataceae bacterium]